MVSNSCYKNNSTMTTKVLKTKPTHNLERRATSTEIKRVSTILSSGSRKKSHSFSDKPTPLDFDTFIPWVCMEWQVPEVVTVVRMNQGKYVGSERRSSSARSKSCRGTRHHKENDESTSKKGTSATNTVVTRNSVMEIPIQISATYDRHGRLAEIAVVSCPPALHRKVLKAISLCLPFHSSLIKLTIRKRCLDYILLHEIGKLLPHTNLTDVCLDNTYVPEGNYYVLLEQASNIKYLSLNRCKVNDTVCKEIASRIDYEQPAEKSLQVLDLSSNVITDIGAKYFGEILRRNRHLLHLNFMGNRLTDTGLGYLVNHLQEFPLTFEEIIAKKHRKMRYIQRKQEVYQHCLEESGRIEKSEEMGSLQSDRRSSMSTKHEKIIKHKKTMPLVVEVESREDMAEKMTSEIIGEFNDPFDDACIVKKDDYNYSTGNFKLCSLNVAYNNIELPSLVKILRVLKYQSLVEKRPPNTGLMRITFEGNNLPVFCPELVRINMYLSQAMNSHIPIHVHQTCQTKKRASIKHMSRR